MKNEDKYTQVSDEVVECLLPIDMSSTLASAKGVKGRAEVRINEKDPTKSRTVVARTVSVTLDWSGVSTKELVKLATLHWSANMGKPAMWQAEHENGAVDMGRVSMREFLDARAQHSRGAASAEAREKAQKVRQVESALNAQGLSLDQILTLLQAGKIKIEA